MSAIAAAVGPVDGWMARLLGDALGPERADLSVLGPGQGPAEDADVLVAATVDRSSLGSLLGPGIRWVHLLGTGVDGFPFDLLGDRVLTCSRGASSVAIAEFVLASMLAFEKQLPDVWLTEPPPHWNLARLGTLAGRTLGLVGLGAIGRATARRALAFDMEVAAVRRRPAAAPAGIAMAGSLHELLARSDHVVLAAPATPGTRHLVDRGAIAAMRPGAHLVNVSRGTLVDQEALLDALDREHLGRATLDVVDPEPLPAGHPLYRHPQTRISAHVSWSSPDTMPRTVGCFADNYRRYRSGSPLEGVVDPAAGY